MRKIFRYLRKMYYKKIKKLTDMQIKINYLRKIGMEIGEECYIFSNFIESAEPYLISIGNHVTIAPNVVFANHDAAINLFIEGISDIYGTISIGNYCFLGMGSIFLPGASIGNNSIVAAGSVVTKKFSEDGIIIGGNPARKIGYVKDYVEKNKHRKLMTWGMTFEEKKFLLLNNKNLLK